MTGRGLGFCVLRLPEEPGGPVTGLAGRRVHPLRLPGDENAELRRLRLQAGRIELALGFLRGRIAVVESVRKREKAGT